MADTVSKDYAHYVSHEVDRKKQCQVCTMFKEPTSCSYVRGRIWPEGTCRFFDPKRKGRTH